MAREKHRKGEVAEKAAKRNFVALFLKSTTSKEKGKSIGMVQSSSESSSEGDSPSEDEAEDEGEKGNEHQPGNNDLVGDVGWDREFRGRPIHAQLDVEDDASLKDDDIDVYYLDNDDGDAVTVQQGVMAHYIFKIHDRLKYETAGDFPALEDKWLLAILRDDENQWWIRKNWHNEFV